MLACRLALKLIYVRKHHLKPGKQHVNCRRGSCARFSQFCSFVSCYCAKDYVMCSNCYNVSFVCQNSGILCISGFLLTIGTLVVFRSILMLVVASL